MITNLKNVIHEPLKQDLLLLEKHINNGDLLWASMVKAKIENNYQVKIVLDKETNG